MPGLVQDRSDGPTKEDFDDLLSIALCYGSPLQKKKKCCDNFGVLGYLIDVNCRNHYRVMRLRS